MNANGVITTILHSIDMIYNVSVRLMMLIAIIWWIIIGTTVADNQINDVAPVEVENVPILTGTASWYDYTLNINWVEKEWSKNHSTCAMRDKEHRYQMFRVCAKATGKCIDCKLNDYWPARQDRVIDLSSYAFRQLWVPLSRGLTEVEIYSI